MRDTEKLIRAPSNSHAVDSTRPDVIFPRRFSLNLVEVTNECPVAHVVSDASTVVVALSCTEAGPTSPSATGGLVRQGSRASSHGTGDIRIGVVQAAASISLGSASDWTITDKASGVVLFTGSGGDATVTFAAAPPAFYRLQVVCGSAATVATRRAAADAAGYVTLTEFVPTANCLPRRVRPPARQQFRRAQRVRNAAISAGHAGTDSFWKVVSLGNATYRVARGSNSAETTNPWSSPHRTVS